MVKKKSSDEEELKGQALAPKSNEALAELNTQTEILIYYNDGRVVQTTVQKVDDVLLREKLNRKRER